MDNINKITIIYKLKTYQQELRIFGNTFVQNNKNKCKLLLNNKLQPLKGLLKRGDIKNKKIIKIKLIGLNKIINMSWMFRGCESLTNIPDISKWNTRNVKNMSGMFIDCESLTNLPDISKWNTSNVNDMSCMFSYCESLINLPDISKWNTNNVNDMNMIFSDCKSLINLPDISK